mmetsp:Transcript_42865/g.107292  ORF Transcript_42865/g.107292 Transcript_42865/m.107292 type:complete len:223 (-) Transcript_42865:2088-2756(-)
MFDALARQLHLTNGAQDLLILGPSQEMQMRTGFAHQLVPTGHHAVELVRFHAHHALVQVIVGVSVVCKVPPRGHDETIGISLGSPLNSKLHPHNILIFLSLAGRARGATTMGVELGAVHVHAIEAIRALSRCACLVDFSAVRVTVVAVDTLAMPAIIARLSLCLLLGGLLLLFLCLLLGLFPRLLQGLLHLLLLPLLLLLLAKILLLPLLLLFLVLALLPRQ